MILILGGSSWIGHYLKPLLPHAHAPRERMTGRLDELRNLSFSTLINLARGESDEDFAWHQALIKLLNERGGRYLYASSANAVDANVSSAHAESERGAAQTEYGTFKARCEDELLDYGQRPLVFRFAATHGWAPNRVARTETFLQSLRRGETVNVNTGVVQNRSFVGELARQIATLALDDDAEGIFHLGPPDASEELDFLSQLAIAFGYPAARVQAGEAMNWNLSVTPTAFLRRYPQFNLGTEEGVIHAVRAQPELAHYVNSPGSA